MILVVCLDDRNGMMFHRRRLSQDSRMRFDLVDHIGRKKLWMNRYSRKQFVDCPSRQMMVADDFINKAQEGELAFVEDMDPLVLEKKIEQIVIYRWNRIYPSDLKFSIPLREHGWNLIEKKEFEGSSHKKITKEVYKK